MYYYTQKINVSHSYNNRYCKEANVSNIDFVLCLEISGLLVVLWVRFIEGSDADVKPLVQNLFGF